MLWEIQQLAFKGYSQINVKYNLHNGQNNRNIYCIRQFNPTTPQPLQFTVKSTTVWCSLNKNWALRWLNLLQRCSIQLFLLLCPHRMNGKDRFSFIRGKGPTNGNLCQHILTFLTQNEERPPTFVWANWLEVEDTAEINTLSALLLERPCAHTH